MNKKLIIFISFILIIIVLSLALIFKFNKQDIDENNNLNEENSENESVDNMDKIKLKVNNIEYEVVLEDNDTVKDLIKLLPLNINMSELNGNEKYYYLDNNIRSNPSKVDKINTGDIMLYGNDCIVIFYESFNTSYSYTRIGKIVNINNLKENLGSGNVNVVFEK